MHSVNYDAMRREHAWSCFVVNICVCLAAAVHNFVRAIQYDQAQPDHWMHCKYWPAKSAGLCSMHRKLRGEPVIVNTTADC